MAIHIFRMRINVILLVVMVNCLLITNGNAFSKLNGLSESRSTHQIHFPADTHVNVVKSYKKEKIILLPVPPKSLKGDYIHVDSKTYDKYRHHHNITAHKYEAIPMFKNINLTQVYHHIPEVHLDKNTPIWIRFPSLPSERSILSNDVNDTEIYSQLNSTSLVGTNATNQSENAPGGIISVASLVFVVGMLFARRSKKKRRDVQTLESVEGDFYYYGTEGIEVPNESDYGSFASPWISDIHKFDV